MRKLILLALVGLVAQLVDGALGMGYGVTSSSLLLLAGLSPALASASVHLAEIGTTLAGGTSHWRLGNTDMRLVARLGLPGAVGAFTGATLLSHLSTSSSTPITATLLALLGAYVLVRFAVRPPAGTGARRSPHGSRLLVPLGLVGGLVDATGGGGWGPVTTTTLMTQGRTAPRTVIGSVSASEFMVTVAASAGFLLGLGTSGLSLGVVAALLAGGLVAAPIAAWLVSRLPGPVLGTAVGGLIVATNLSTLLSWASAPTPVYSVGYTLLVVAWVGFLLLAVRRARAEAASIAMAARQAEATESTGIAGITEAAVSSVAFEEAASGRADEQAAPRSRAQRRPAPVLASQGI